MSIQAIIRHGAFAELAFPIDEDVIAIETTSVQAASEKTVYKSASTSGGIHGLTYTNPTLSFSCKGTLTADTGLFVTQSGTELASFANFTNLGTFAGFTPATSLMVFEDPAIDGSAGTEAKMSFNVFVCPALPT
jgi:hypothetical protein